MRLSSVARGTRLKDKALFALIRVLRGHSAPDVIRVLRYRPRYFGAPFNQIMHEVMRGPSEWSVGERELFAAFVAKYSDCEF